MGLSNSKLKKMRFINPVKIIFGWILLIILVDIIALPTLFHNTIGGEQLPLVFLMNSIIIAAYGILSISILSTIIYFKSIRRFWLTSLFFGLIAAIYIINDAKMRYVSYSCIESCDSISGYEIKSKKEFYSLNPDILRSVSYWRNGERDSIWRIYDKTGKVIEEHKYGN